MVGWKWQLIGQKWKSINEMRSMVLIINESLLGSIWCEAAMGSRAGLGAGLGCMEVGHGIGACIGVSVGGDCVEEEDMECWLDTMVFIFKRMTSSLEAMEAWVAAKMS